jgi:chlorobactene glucosyltransferase
VLLNLISWPYLKESKGFSTHIKVSVLIPARNEAKHIVTILELLLKQTHKPYEILVYDDDSTDATAEIVSLVAEKNTEVKVIRGAKLPEGWLGKNHACHQLAKQANGHYFLFLDADVIPYPELIEKALSQVRRKNLKLLSLFPHQQMNSFGEMLVVPLMHNILLSLLPLFYVRKSHRPSFSAANGQFMFFEADTYKKIQPHAWVKMCAVEDIRIMKLYKKFHLNCETLLGNKAIECRMYSGFSESVSGFSKNMSAFFGGSLSFMFLYKLLGVAGWLSWFTLPFNLIAIGFALLVTYHIKLNVLAGSKIWMLLLTPIQCLAAFWVAINCIRTIKNGTLEWKGRSIQQ